jgi:hypothetical protein
MILPVPFPNSVSFHNLENYENFFTDCEKCFVRQTRGYSAMNSLGAKNETDTLEVFSVGSYNVSLGYSLKDLEKVDTSVFTISKELEEMLKKYYSNPVFGFIICKLKYGNEKYHPFAYSHNIADEKVFIPTKHFHVEEDNNYYNNYNKYTSENINNSPMFNWAFVSNNSVNNYKKKDDEYADDWGHDIYLYNININTNTQVRNMNTCQEVWNNKINIDYNKIDFSLDKNCRIFNKIQIDGKNPNIDLVFPVA